MRQRSSVTHDQRHQPGKYENAVNPVPAPNGWFRRAWSLRTTRQPSTRPAREGALSLVILLNDRRNGSVGLWVGNNSSGDFANLVILPGV